MRNNYGGRLPHGGKIIWDITTQIPSPIVWKAEPGPNDGVLWDSTKVKQWNNPQKAGSRQFVPYMWLGAGERGLAWFGESESAYVVGDKPIQEIERRGDTVILRVRLIRKPVTGEEKPTVAVEDDSIKWIYLTREESPKGLLLLQSYNPDAVTKTVSVPGAKQLVDIETSESIPLSKAHKAHSAKVPIPAYYGTRMFLVPNEDGPLPIRK